MVSTQNAISTTFVCVSVRHSEKHNSWLLRHPSQITPCHPNDTLETCWAPHLTLNSALLKIKRCSIFSSVNERNLHGWGWEVLNKSRISETRRTSSSQFCVTIVFRKISATSFIRVRFAFRSLQKLITLLRSIGPRR